VTVQVESTRLAERQISALRGRVKNKFENCLDQLVRDGCRVLDYRLTGDIIERLCVKHFHSSWRVVVAFRTPHDAVIMLVGQHDRDDPGMDVYTMLYELAGLTVVSAQKRSKPPCCGDEMLPPLWEDNELNDLVQRAQHLARRRR
jgi:hypothetical protein